MFTGIIEEVGTIESILPKKNLVLLKVKAKKVLKSIKIGHSIAVDGVCLTVTAMAKQSLSFDVMKESLMCTTLGDLKVNDHVNLERALKANGRVDGHFVTGHVDDMGVLKQVIAGENYTEFQIGLKKGLREYIVSKGSVTLDGVSLTVGAVKKNYFSVYLIPFTKKMTTFRDKKVGAKMNIETDILAKYIRGGCYGA